MISKTIQLSLAFLLLLMVSRLYPCTTGLADKNYSDSQRALLWKNRDSSHEMNELYYFDFGDVQFIGLINNNDTTQVWSGVNNFGFAIMNAESRDLISPDSTEYDDEGYLMKAALKTCRTIDEFEAFLKTSNEKGRKVTSNFGVIDASGKAAYFETGNHVFFRYDADNEFLIRANFSLQGRGMKKYGLFRYHRAKKWFKKLKSENQLTAVNILKQISSDAYLPPTITPDNFMQYEAIKINDTIFRYSSVAATVVAGTHENENPELMTFWVNLGAPAASVAIPLWVYSQELPGCLNGTQESELNAIFRKLRDYMGDGKKYISPEKYMTVKNGLADIQETVYQQTERLTEKWRSKSPTRKAVARAQKELTQTVLISAKKLMQKLVH